MTKKRTSIENYCDPLGNEIINPGNRTAAEVAISFGGKCNHLTINESAILQKIAIDFRGSNATVSIGACKTGAIILIGSNSDISLEDGTSSTGTIYMTAFEGSSISIGRDCMFAGGVQIRADDAHPIFDIKTGQRVNKSRPVRIGDHVWICEGAVILNGSDIGSGSIIGTRSIVKGKITNNCVAAGTPARITRRNVAWERPHFSQEALFTAEGTLRDHDRQEYWQPSKEQLSREKLPKDG